LASKKGKRRYYDTGHEKRLAVREKLKEQLVGYEEDRRERGARLEREGEKNGGN